jgi:hypothetical protein
MCSSTKRQICDRALPASRCEPVGGLASPTRIVGEPTGLLFLGLGKASAARARARAPHGAPYEYSGGMLLGLPGPPGRPAAASTPRCSAPWTALDRSSRA